MQRLLHAVVHPVSVVGMDSLPYSFAAREALPRIKSPHSVPFLGPIKSGCLVEGPRTGVAQTLCFCQIAFALTQPSLGSLQILNIDVCSIPLHDLSPLVTQR